jgi:hypothetical protein
MLVIIMRSATKKILIHRCDMDKNEISMLKEKVHNEYSQRIEELKLEMGKKLEAINIVAEIVGDNSSLAPSNQTIQLSRKESSKTAGASLVEEIINEMEGNFSMRDVKKLLLEKYQGFEFSRNSWHTAINKMKNNKEIEVIQKGAGRAPSVFKKTEIYGNKAATENLTTEGESNR